MTEPTREAIALEALADMQRAVDDILREALDCYEGGAIKEAELLAFGLIPELFHRTDRRSVLGERPHCESKLIRRFIKKSLSESTRTRSIAELGVSFLKSEKRDPRAVQLLASDSARQPRTRIRQGRFGALRGDPNPSRIDS
jgi:hypothetical protein